jgi:hypothetical protein
MMLGGQRRHHGRPRSQWAASVDGLGRPKWRRPAVMVTATRIGRICISDLAGLEGAAPM